MIFIFLIELSPYQGRQPFFLRIKSNTSHVEGLFKIEISQYIFLTNCFFFRQDPNSGRAKKSVDPSPTSVLTSRDIF